MVTASARVSHAVFSWFLIVPSVMFSAPIVVYPQP